MLSIACFLIDKNVLNVWNKFLCPWLQIKINSCSNFLVKWLCADACVCVIFKCLKYDTILLQLGNVVVKKYEYRYANWYNSKQMQPENMYRSQTNYAHINITWQWHKYVTNSKILRKPSTGPAEFYAFSPKIIHK